MDDRKYFKLDNVDKPENKTNCTCGAWITEQPNYHSEWCDAFKKKTDLDEYMDRMMNYWRTNGLVP